MTCTNYCKNHQCSKCGQCCTPLLPITRHEEKVIRSYIKENNIKPEDYEMGNSVNLQCCFYDRKNKCCKIYKVRPKICQSFKCDRNIEDLEKEKMANHRRAHYNHIEKTCDMPKNVTDMRLLFYDDPRTLVNIIIYEITNGTLEATEKDFEFLKQFLIAGGQEELAKCLEPTYE